MAEDRDLLLAGFAALSGRSRRSRFLRGVSDAQFERMRPVLLDTVDQQSHVALLLDADGRPIGVGRLRRFPSDPSVADLAVTVADDWHGRGAGTVLARQLLARAGSGVGWLALAGCPKAGAADTVESAQPLNRWVPQTHLVAGLRRTPPDGVSGRGLGHRHAGLSAGSAGTNGDPFATPEAA